MVKDPLKIYEDARLVLEAARALSALHPDDKVVSAMVQTLLYERTAARLPGVDDKARINRYVRNVLAEAANLHTEETLEQVARSFTKTERKRRVG